MLHTVAFCNMQHAKNHLIRKLDFTIFPEKIKNDKKALYFSVDFCQNDLKAVLHFMIFIK